MNPHFILNRRSEWRENETKISELFEKKTTRILLTHKGKFIGNENSPRYFSLERLIEYSIYDKPDNDELIPQIIYLGELEKTNYFVIQVTDLNEQLATMQLLDLRTAALSAELFDIGSLFYSQGLINWHFTHPYCAKCGSLSSPSQAGHSRTCNNQNCAKEHFPRIEPAVIFSIETTINGVNKLLLARQANWPQKRYSVIAGFAEHGESLEAAVAREAYEEVGLSVNNVKYVASQPWPFPASLMLGFACETKQTDIRLIDDELEHAQWFSASEMKEAIENGDLLMPFSVSISWQLVDRWYSSQTDQSIKEVELKR